MLHVIFTEIDDDSIKIFEKIPLSEANYLTETLEKKYRKEKKKTIGEFYVIDLDNESDRNEVLYKGSYKFGYYESPNIYQHIKKRVPSIKVSKEKEHAKSEFLEKLEEETEDKYKVEEDNNVDLEGVERDRISSLNRTQRRSIYALTVLAIVSLLLVTILFNVKNASNVRNIQGMQITLQEQSELNEIYEQGLMGKEDIVTDYLNNTTKITDGQKLILANMLIKEEKFKQVVDLYDGDVSFVEDLVSTSKQTTLQDTINLLKKYDEAYPTNQAKYDLAYWSGNYELMLKIPEVKMNAKRSRMKTYAHLKLGQLEEAKEEVANNNNEKLKSQINNYELLVAEIEMLNEKIETANYDEAKSLKEELEQKEKELEEI